MGDRRDLRRLKLHYWDDTTDRGHVPTDDIIMWLIMVDVVDDQVMHWNVGTTGAAQPDVRRASAELDLKGTRYPGLKATRYPFAWP